MRIRWQFRARRTMSGNVVTVWLGKDKALKARLDSYLRRLRDMDFPWPFPYYEPLGDGVGEIRLDFRRVERRLYGFFEEESFIVLHASSDKKAQPAMIQGTKRLKKQIKLNQFKLETEEYVV